MHELLDEYGYPTEYALNKIKDWEMTNKEDYHDLMRFCKKIWRYEEYFNKEENKYVISTGGWSGNEDIIWALQKNSIFWLLYWEQSRRGGHYIFSTIGE